MLISIADLGRGQKALDPFIQRATSLSQMWDYFIENDEEESHKRLPGIHASELGCDRKVLYTLQDAKKKNNFDKKWKQRFKMGHAIHKMVQLDFLRLAAKSRGLVEFEDEVPISPKHQKISEELQLTSACDGVFTLRERADGPVVLRVGLEIKSASPDDYESLKAPKPDHVRQAHLYMKALDLPLMWFLYFNKGNQNNVGSHAPWLIAYQESEWLAIEAQCRRLLKMFEEQKTTLKMPERNEGIFCEFCSYSWTCAPEYLKRRRQYEVRPIRGTR